MFRKQLILLGILSGILLAILGTLALIGGSIPEKHQVISSDIIEHKQAKVWEHISNISKLAEWNPSISKVESIKGKEGHWQEFYATGDSMTYETVSLKPPFEMVRQIADDKAPFQGRWTISLKALSPEQTEITIIEDGSIENPFLRFMVHHLSLIHI